MSFSDVFVITIDLKGKETLYVCVILLKMITPMLETIAQEYDGKLIVAKVNTDENPQWAMRYGVQGIPTLLFISRGQAVGQQVGVVPAHVIKSKTDTLLQVVFA